MLARRHTDPECVGRVLLDGSLRQSGVAWQASIQIWMLPLLRCTEDRPITPPATKPSMNPLGWRGGTLSSFVDLKSPPALLPSRVVQRARLLPRVPAADPARARAGCDGQGAREGRDQVGGAGQDREPVHPAAHQHAAFEAPAAKARLCRVLLHVGTTAAGEHGEGDGFGRGAGRGILWRTHTRRARNPALGFKGVEGQGGYRP